MDSDKWINLLGLSTFWAAIKRFFCVRLDATTIALFTELGWEATEEADEDIDWTIDSSVIELYEELGCEGLDE